MKKRTRQRTRRKVAAPGPVRREASPPQLVQIEKAIYGGAFLARLDGKAVFVPMALPGEQARVQIVEEKRGYATAEVEEIVAAAAERIKPACKHFGACGGCQYQHASYTAQLAMKREILVETLERGGVRAPDEIAVLAGVSWAYRNRIRLALDAEGNVGYRGRRSHAVVTIDECPIAAPLLVRAALAVGEIVRGLNSRMRPSEIALFCNGDETALLVLLMVASGESRWLVDFAQALAERIPELKGVELVAEGGTGQPPRSIAKWGASSLLYRAAEFNYRVDQGAFFQVNRWLVDRLVECVTDGHAGGLAWDLFAGVGLFARQLADGISRVVAVESAPAAIAALRQNLDGTSAAAVQAATLDFLHGARSGERPDLIVVDPPRMGLGAETTALLGQIAAPVLVYVSCDPATLARDLRALIGTGYAIESVTLADLFPQTFHLETVVRLRR
ncbi:MAG: 23S rRNA (uracil(1939)-C(5))-methyltransferase RlmD [Terracidiphilus sp.]